MSNDFVDQPLLKRLNKRNIITRLENVETAVGAKPSAQVAQAGEIAPDTGEMTVTSLTVVNHDTGLGDVVINQYGILFRNQEGEVIFQDTNGGSTMEIYADGTNTIVIKNAFGGEGIRFDIDNASHAVKQIEFDGDGNLILLDGTYMVSASNLPISAGWWPVTETWTRTGNHTYTVPGDLTTRYRKGTKVSYDDGSVDFGVIASSVASTDPITTVSLIPNTDYLMAAATITTTLISYIENPESWPDWFNFLTVVTPGTGAITTYAVTVSKWRASGAKYEHVYDIAITDNGTGATYLQLTTAVTMNNGIGNGINTATLAQGFGAAVGASFRCRKYDGTYPVASAQSFRLSAVADY